MYEQFVSDLLAFTKAEVIEYGQLLGVWKDNPNTTESLEKQTKMSLCCFLADKLMKRDLRGY